MRDSVENIKVRRPDNEMDYERLERNSLKWDSPEFQTTREWFAQVSANEPAQEFNLAGIPYWSSTIRDEGPIHRSSKNWSTFIIEDRDQSIIGRIFFVGVTDEFWQRHSNPAEPGALFPASWSDLYVPDPANPLTTRHALVQMMLDFNQGPLASAMTHVSALNAALFRIDGLLTQIHVGPGLREAIVAKRYGFRRVRWVRPPAPQSLVDRLPNPDLQVWAWERGAWNPAETSISRPCLPNDGIAHVARFYQSLNQQERTLMSHLLRGANRKRLAEALYVTVHRVDQLISGVRDKLLEIRDELVASGVLFKPPLANAQKPDDDPDRSDSRNLSTLLMPLTNALKHLEWFYGKDN